MRREYDILEKFSDGSTLWRASVAGRFEAQRKLQHLAEHSDNEFFVIQIPNGELLPLSFARSPMRPAAKKAAAG